MLGQRTKLLPPSFFSESPVDGNNNESATSTGSLRADFSDDDSAEECDWVPLGFAPSNVDGTVSKKATDQFSTPTRNGVDGDDPFNFTSTNLRPLGHVSVETGRKRCSPYSPLVVSSMRNETSPKSREKYVRLTDKNDLLCGSYVPIRHTSDEDSDDASVVLRSERQSTEDHCDDSLFESDNAVSSIGALTGPAVDSSNIATLKAERATDADVVIPASPSCDAVSASRKAENAADAEADFFNAAAPCDNTTEESVEAVIRISKQLSWVLRHGAHRVGLKIDDDGFLDVESILKLREFDGVTLEDVISIVKGNDKKRFTLMTDSETGLLKVRANQGHSIAVNKLDIKKITAMAASSRFYRNVIHGTNSEAWELIKETGGLSRMTRNHIHFAMGTPGDAVLSGIRSHSTILVYVDIARAIRDGFEFFISANKVILTPGNSSGFLPVSYFSKVIQVAPYKKLPIPEVPVENREPTSDHADLNLNATEVVSNYPVLLSSPTSPSRSDASSPSYEECHDEDGCEAYRPVICRSQVPSPCSLEAVALAQPLHDGAIDAPQLLSSESFTASLESRSTTRRSARHVNFEWGIVRSSLDMTTAPDRNLYPRSPCSPFRTPPPASQLPQPLPDFLRKTKIALHLARPQPEVSVKDDIVGDSLEPHQVNIDLPSSDIPDLEPFPDQMSNYMPLLD